MTKKLTNRLSFSIFMWIVTIFVHFETGQIDRKHVAYFDYTTWCLRLTIFWQIMIDWQPFFLFYTQNTQSKWDMFISID